MTDKQRAFVEFYISCGFNASEAARQAGYSKKTAGSMGEQLLKKIEIKTQIKKRIKELLSQTEQLTMRWVDRVTEIAFSEPNELRDRDGDVYGYDHSNQLKALDLLAKYLSLYSDLDLKTPDQQKQRELSKEERRNRILELSKKMKSNG